MVKFIANRRKLGSCECSLISALLVTIDSTDYLQFMGFTFWINFETSIEEQTVNPLRLLARKLRWTITRWASLLCNYPENTYYKIWNRLCWQNQSQKDLGLNDLCLEVEFTTLFVYVYKFDNGIRCYVNCSRQFLDQEWSKRRGLSECQHWLGTDTWWIRVYGFEWWRRDFEIFEQGFTLWKEGLTKRTRYPFGLERVGVMLQKVCAEEFVCFVNLLLINQRG